MAYSFTGAEDAQRIGKSRWDWALPNAGKA
jgi:hypothetical protein